MMGKVVVCDECGTRLDGELERQDDHVRIVMTIDRLGIPTETIERDFCGECSPERIIHFKAAPFLVGISGGPS